MVSTSGFQTITKIIEDISRLSLERDRITFSININETGLSIMRYEWEQDDSNSWRIVPDKDGSYVYCTIFGALYQEDGFDDIIADAHREIHEDIENILAKVVSE